MNFGVSADRPAKNSIFVVVKAVAETRFVPFTNISAVVPFHFIAIFTVSVKVKYNSVPVPAILFTTRNLPPPMGVDSCKQFVVPKLVSPIKIPSEPASLT